MTDTPAPSAPSAPVGPLRALDVRLPVLRRPPGWGVLDEPALRVRATQLYLVCMQQVGQEAGAGLGRSAWSSGPLSPEVSPKDSPTHSPEHSLEEAGLDPARTVPHAELAAQHPAVHPAEPKPRKGSHWHLLPWVLLLGGFMIMTPWLIWAPLVGGLCMGLLLLQTGMLRHWLQARTLQEEAAAGASDLLSNGFAQTRGLGDEAGIEAVQAVGPRRLRFAHGGWMLTAALVLVGVQAAMLITTLQLKSQEPAAMVGAIRAAQPGRDARQGTPPGPQETRALLRDGSAAVTAAPRPEEEGTTGPRPGGTP